MVEVLSMKGYRSLRFEETEFKASLRAALLTMPLER